MNSVIQFLAERVVGTVEEVFADKIEILLDPDAPQATALNMGSPMGFPRINNYLLIPNETGATVGWITSVRIERLPYPKRKGLQDFGLVDLPFPCRIVTITPIGTLKYSHETNGAEIFEFQRGVDVFPSVGDPVILPTIDQLQTIVAGESPDKENRILIGHCPLAGGAPVYVDPNKLFGRHLAILGNTGAGKSCSVAGLIRWCLEAANKERKNKEREGFANARFIILDPNGEYATAFKDLGEGVVRLFQVDTVEDNAKPLKVPAWLWNGEEWVAFTEASPGIQRPILLRTLRYLRSEYDCPNPFTARLYNSAQRRQTQLEIAKIESQHLIRGKREEFAQTLLSIAKDFNIFAQDCPFDNLKQKIKAVAKTAENIEKNMRADAKYEDGGYWHKQFSDADIENLKKLLLKVITYIEERDDFPLVGEDIPKYFDIKKISRYVEVFAMTSSTRDLIQFVDSLNLRIQSLIHREGLTEILNPEDSASIKVDEWLKDYIGANNASNGQIVVIDLSLVPSEVIHIVIGVLARLIFEALQRYRREHKKELPTVLVLEEAHTFVHKDLTSENAPATARTCCRIFERIAREGRKFGLGLVLASQRPFELSPTVLSQCNTFLLHRIVNNYDQELVKKLVPDGYETFLRELPNLPSRRAILLGWAAPAPVLVEIRELPEQQRPQSPDPHFWGVWTGAKDGDRSIDWNSIVRDWVKEDKLKTEEEVSEKRPPVNEKPEEPLDLNDLNLDDLPF